MTYLLDTCVLSETTKPSPDPNVVHWLGQTPDELKFVSVLSLAEIRFGILTAYQGTKRQRLLEWYRDVLRPSLSERVYDFDEVAAMKWAEFRAERQNAPVVDAQIAATAVVHQLTLVTRNERDFRFPGLTVFNPWEK